MDAFAENQMGRDDGLATSPPSRRERRMSREEKKREKEEDIGGSSSSVPKQEGDALSSAMEAENVEVPVMSIEESGLIATRWNRKQSTFMPVGDPYGEPDTSIPYSQQLAKEYCTSSQLARFAWRSLVNMFPFLDWLPKISKASLVADVVAGFTVGVMLIPQSMSYADIAGLQYRYGLYTSVLPLITYALMGTSRQLGVGPVAMVSLLVEVGLQGALTKEECPEYYAQNFTQANRDLGLIDEQYVLCPDAYAQLAFLTSLLVGLFQIGAGMLRLGFLVSFLAHPVISGFTSAAAIIIGLSQLQYFLGFKIPKSQYITDTLTHVFTNLHNTQPAELAFGLGWWFMLWGSRKLAIKYKKSFGWLRAAAPLLTCVLAILVGGNLQLFNGCGFQRCDPDYKSKLIVGNIPAGVDSMGSIHLLDLSKMGRVLTTAISCAIIGYMESIAIAKSLAAKHKYEVSATSELFALGVANCLGAMTSSYPVTGSFSRSAVNNQVGAKTQLAGLITGCLLLLTLVLLTPLFYFLPKFALAAIVISSVTNLVDYKEAIHLFKVKKQDCLLWFVAFFGTLFLGVQIGLILAVGVSLALVIIESVRPQMTVLWRLPNTQIYRNIKQEDSGQFVPGVVILRIGASMYFANVSFIRDFISKMLAEFSEASAVEVGLLSATPDHNGEEGAEGPTPIQYIVIEMTPVQSMDSTAVHMIEDMQRALKERGIRLCFSTLNSRVESTMDRAGLIDKMGAQWFHPSVHLAVQHCIRHRTAATAIAQAAKGNGARNGGDVIPPSPKLMPFKVGGLGASPKEVTINLGNGAPARSGQGHVEVGSVSDDMVAASAV